MSAQVAKMLVAAGLLVYPLAIYFAHEYLTASQLTAGLLGLLALRVCVAAWMTRRRVVAQLLLAGLLGASAAAVGLWLPEIRMDWLRFYPALFDLAVCAVFFGSLFTSRPLVERFARLLNDELPQQAVAYTRRATWAWSGVMLLVALVSVYTTMAASFRLWSLFNGLIVYIVLGLVFVCEYLIRRHCQKRWEAA